LSKKEEAALGSDSQQDAIKQAIVELLEPVELDPVVGCAIPLSPGKPPPPVTLLHVAFNEDKPKVSALAHLLWQQCINYSLSKRRRLSFYAAMKASPGDLSQAAEIIRSVQNIFIEFRRKYPQRASEVGEVLAYCVAVRYLNAAQVAAKMSLKTSSNMPVHGLDGIHMAFENGALTVYFLESKLSKSANKGAREYASSVAEFAKNEKQYLREYEIVGDLSNLDTLTGAARAAALEYLDVVGSPSAPKRERYMGVICYSERLFSSTLPVDDGDPAKHGVHFCLNYQRELDHHSESVARHLIAEGAEPGKCKVFFVAVPDVDELRERFYAAAGLMPMTENKGRRATARKRAPKKPGARK
jgi:hypothetical protein